jgi:hypothetical protein
MAVTLDGWILCLDDGNHGREPWLYKTAEGVALELGQPCGNEQATLHGTAPRIGRPLLGCGFGFDPVKAMIEALGSPPPIWKLDLTIPLDLTLPQVQVEARIVVVPPPFDRLSFSNELGLKIGR